jgi:uncharacterized delta-60 repeat protein
LEEKMKKTVVLLFVVVVGSLTLALSYVRANPGAFDPTWGDEGVVITDFEGMDDSATTSIVMPDGKLVMAGWVNVYPGDFGVARYLRDGRLDPSFGDGGRVATAFYDDPDLVDAAWGINVRPEGGVHVFGETCDADYFVCEFAMAAYNADGSLDESFGEDGLVTTPVDSATTVFSWPSHNILQPDGKVVAGGIALYEDEATEVIDVDLVLVRYNPDGSLDESFGDNGIAIIDFEGKAHFPQDIIGLPGDKILVVGGVTDEFEGFSYLPQEAFMTRINNDGTVDSTFAGGGYSTWQYDGQPTGFDAAMVISENEMIIVGGPADIIEGGDCSLQRFDLDGNLDTTFGDNGWVIIDTGQLDLCLDSNLTVDGKIAFVGQVAAPDNGGSRAVNHVQHRGRITLRSAQSTENALAARQEETFDHIVGLYNPDGTPDPTFGENGLVRFTYDDSAGIFATIAPQPDGKLLVVGDVLVGEQIDFGALRFLGDGPAAQVYVPVTQR